MALEMHSRSAAFFIAFILFWSAFATYGQVVPAAPLAGITGATTWTAASPQQEESGAADLQQENESATAQAEGGADSPELIPHMPGSRMPALVMARPRPLDAASWRAPVLDGLRRPPRAGLPTA